MHRANSPIAAGGDDTVLPSQFWAVVSDPRTEPEKRLMIAVLEEAIALLVSDAAGADRAERAAAVRDAERWIACDDQGSPFAFAAICDILGLDVSRVRETIAAWRTRKRLFRRPRIQAGRGRHQVRGERRRASSRAA